MSENKRIQFSILIAILGVAIMVVLGYYIANLFNPKLTNVVVTDDDKTKLNYLMQAIVYDGYNYYPKTSLEDIRFSDMSELGKVTIAAKYLYLLNNGRINPKEEEINLNMETTNLIIKQARKMFDNMFIKYRNFSITLDNNGCGATVFSSDYGVENNNVCSSKAGAFEIKNIYYKDGYYVVEAYIAFGQEKLKKTGSLVCATDEDKIMSYFSVYRTVTFYTAYGVKEYNKCCKFDLSCGLEGASPKQDFMMAIAKKENFLYKVLFKKQNDNFIPYQID